jgi:signal transduction histidine kinase
VSDTGVGMDAVTQAHIFEPFFNDEGAGQGHRTRLVDGVRDREAERRQCLCLQRTRYGSSFKVYLPRTEAEVGVS